MATIPQRPPHTRLVTRWRARRPSSREVRRSRRWAWHSGGCVLHGPAATCTCHFPLGGSRKKRPRPFSRRKAAPRHLNSATRTVAFGNTSCSSTSRPVTLSAFGQLAPSEVRQAASAPLTGASAVRFANCLAFGLAFARAFGQEPSAREASSTAGAQGSSGMSRRRRRASMQGAFSRGSFLDRWRAGKFGHVPSPEAYFHASPAPFYGAGCLGFVVRKGMLAWAMWPLPSKA